MAVLLFFRFPVNDLGAGGKYSHADQGRVSMQICLKMCGVATGLRMLMSLPFGH